MKLFPIAILLIFITLRINAQDVYPLVTGSVDISVKKGTFTCDLSIKDMPKVAGNYAIRINSGMNIRSFQDISTGKLLDYDLDTTDHPFEAKSYYFQTDRGDNKLLKEGVRCKYIGMYPVVDSLSGFNFMDWRGNVAFTKNTLRADGLQCEWYPVLYDIKNQRRYEEVRYDIKITCTDCKMIYVNGDSPKKGPVANFKSERPKEMLLFCGDYRTQSNAGLQILNGEMTPKEFTAFENVVSELKHYYEEHINIPYKGQITFIQTAPTATADHAFTFVAYPTIVKIGVDRWSLKNSFKKDNASRDKAYIAHELGHYYFGTLLNPNSAFGPIIDESFAEYLSYKVTEEKIDKKYYDDEIKSKATALKRFKHRPLSQIITTADLNDREFFVRIFVPEMLVALEKEIGREKMWTWLRIMVTTPTTFTDYEFFKKTFYEAVADKDLADKLTKKYFESVDAPVNVMQTILGK